MKRRIKYKWQERQAHFDERARQRKMLLDEINGRMFGRRVSGKPMGILTTLMVRPEDVLPAEHEDMVIHIDVDFDRKGFWRDVSKARFEDVLDGLLADSPAREDSNPIDESHGQSGQ